jgi:hypothetical protein
VVPSFPLSIEDEHRKRQSYALKDEMQRTLEIHRELLRKWHQARTSGEQWEECSKRKLPQVTWR